MVSYWPSAICHGLLMKIVLSVVTLWASFMLLKGSGFLCMVLIRIVFLYLINLVRLSFSCVLMKSIKSKQLDCTFCFIICWNESVCHLALCVYLFCHWAFAHLIYSGRHWAFFTATSSSPCWTKNSCSIFSCTS